MNKKKKVLNLKDPDTDYIVIPQNYNGMGSLIFKVFVRYLNPNSIVCWVLSGIFNQVKKIGAEILITFSIQIHSY